MWDNLFSTADLLQKGFDAANTRYKVIANNIANVDTPGFKASEVEFESLMAEALGLDGETGEGTGLALTTTDENHAAFASQMKLAATDEKHASDVDGLSMTATNEKHHQSAGGDSALDEVEPVVVTDDTSLRYDENNVDVESEMVELAKNTINYYALTNQVNSEFTKLKTVINA